MTTEQDIQTAIRLAASQQGHVLWRNNSGVLRDERGVPVRFGLCNDSAQLNAQCKSSDLVGIKQVLVTQEMVGTVVGVFWAVECKRAGWKYKATDREVAQLRFIEAVRGMGGVGQFASGVGDI
jgi:hypothetical protein